MLPHAVSSQEETKEPCPHRADGDKGTAQGHAQLGSQAQGCSCLCSPSASLLRSVLRPGSCDTPSCLDFGVISSCRR